MNTYPETCDPSLIERYLADLLNTAQEVEFYRHLETCETCRQQIQLAAAEPSSWSDAEEFLRDQPFDSVAFGSSASLSSHDGHNAHDRKAAASAEVAQVLGMLHPTDDPCPSAAICNDANTTENTCRITTDKHR